jgi:SNF2 family DNA or RNA helicase
MTKLEKERAQELIDRMDKDDEFLVGALLHIYSFQTLDEQATESTRHLNDVGFNALDAGIMSSFAEFYNRTGFLSPKQLNLARRKMKKYTRQMIPYTIKPASIKGRQEKKSNAKPIKERMTVTLGEDNKMIVKFSFPKDAEGKAKFSETLKNVKSIKGKRWDPEKKQWTIPLSLMSMKSLMYWGFELSGDLRDWHDRTIIDIDALEPLKPNLRDGKELRPFQELGIAYVEKANGRGIIGDVMGLGKTVQALGWLSLHPEAFPALVICPANVKYNWEREVKKWLPDDYRVKVISGRFKPVNSPEEVDEDFIDDFMQDITKTIFIANYDIINNATEDTKVGGKIKKKEIRGTGWGDFLKNIHMITVILDEFHYINNNKALRTKTVKRLAKNADHLMALSGTPIVNRPVEFFNGIELVNPNIFPGWWYFVHKFCAAYHDGYGLVTNGSSNEDKLNKILTSTIMIRREKKDVYDQLPEKVRSIIPLDIENRKEYMRAQKDIIGWIRENEGREKADKASGTAALVEFEKLKQLAVTGKLNSCVSWIRDMLDSGEKLIVFADHKFAVNHLMDAFPGEAVKIDGSVSADKRMAIVDEFQNNDDIRLFVGSKAAKEGLTLDVSSNVAFIELYWTPGDHDQAEDRCYGRLSNPHGANIWYLVAVDTIEEDIAQLLDKKRRVVGAILDGKPIDSPSILTELIERVKERNHG